MSNEMVIYTDEDGIIVRLEDPLTKKRTNFYGTKRLERSIVATPISRLSEAEVKDLCLNYFLKKVENGSIINLSSAKKKKALQARFKPYLNSSHKDKIKDKIKKKYGITV